MTEDEIRKLAEDFFKEWFPEPTLIECEKCHANNCIYNETCIKCNEPILEVYRSIVKILESNGFEKALNGDMVRRNTGCDFPFDYLSKFKSTVDFQLEWGYS